MHSVKLTARIVFQTSGAKRFADDDPAWKMRFLVVCIKGI